VRQRLRGKPSPWLEALRGIYLVSQLGLTVVAGALVGWACGLGVDRLVGHGKSGQVVGLFLGLGGGIWGAWRELKLSLARAKDDRGE